MFAWPHDTFAYINDFQKSDRMDLDVIDRTISTHLVLVGDVGVRFRNPNGLTCLDLINKKMGGAVSGSFKTI